MHPGPKTLISPSALRQRALQTSVAILAVGLIPVCVHAQQWRVAPELSVGLEYDDNASLIPDSVTIDQESAEAYEIEGAVRLSYETELSEFYLTPLLRISRFDSQPELDADDKFLDFGFTRTGQLSRFRFRGNVSDESIRTAERSDVDFGVDDPDDIPVDDSARVLQTEARQRISVAADFRREVGRRSLIVFQAEYLDLDYGDSQLDLLNDYAETRVRGAYEFRASERDAFEIGGFYRQSELEGGGDPSGSGATLGYIRRLTENSRFILRAGVDSTEDPDGGDQTNPVGEISFVQNFEVSRVLASYRRNIAGGGSNILSVRDQISINFRRPLSERVEMGLGARAYQTRALDDLVTTFDERDFVELRGLLSWRLTRIFTLEFDYRYTFLDRQEIPGDATSNRINVWFRFAPRNE